METRTLPISVREARGLCSLLFIVHMLSACQSTLRAPHHCLCILATPHPRQVEDELLLVRAALQRIARLSADMGFDEIIQNSAMTYMTRFYVHTSVLDVLPQDLLYVSWVYPSPRMRALRCSC